MKNQNEIKGTKWTENEIEIIKNNYEEKGAKWCSQFLTGRTYSSIKRKAENMGISFLARRKFLNENLFLNPNTPEIAYILGLIWADGHVAKNNLISIHLESSDMEEIIPTAFRVGNWGIHARKDKKYKDNTTIYSGNKLISEFLRGLDYNSKNWSSAEKILEKIPENLRKYWFRGLIDGDGCFYFHPRGTTQFCIASGFDQNWNFVENLLKKLNIVYKIKKQNKINKITGKQNRSSVIRICNYRGIKNLGNYIYQNRDTDGIGLTRKYEKWKYIIENFGSTFKNFNQSKNEEFL